MRYKIPFNKPYIIGNEIANIKLSVAQGQISGNGIFTKKCQTYFEEKYGFNKCLLTTSCTDALEMSALLLEIKEGDEIIVPSYTFVSSALAFVREGAKIVFCDSREDHPGMDEAKIEELITPRTKAIVVVHYAGVAVDMNKIMALAIKYNLLIVEDAAQAFDSYYKGKPLGSIGHLGCFSFHETKNLQCGEGGLLSVNDDKFLSRAEIIWEKGTNRAEFFRGEINKYGWVDVGSSFLPSEINAAFLWGQLENSQKIQNQRKHIWHLYNQFLEPLREKVKLPVIPDYATNNAHMYYLVCNSAEERTRLLSHLRNNGIQAVFHYLSLHKSKFMRKNYRDVNLPYSDLYTERLVRLPFYFELSDEKIEFISRQVINFYT